jgi:hypothetical protein
MRRPAPRFSCAGRRSQARMLAELVAAHQAAQRTDTPLVIAALVLLALLPFLT